MSIPDISKFNLVDFAAFINSFDTVLTDCDGVLWMLGDPIEGSQEAIALFEALGKRIFYVTNNGAKKVKKYVADLGALGYNITEEQVITPAVAVAHALKKRGFQGNAHVLGSTAFHSDLEATGVQCSVPTPLNRDEEMTLENFINRVRKLRENVDAVVMDYTPIINYAQLQEASTFLAKPDCLFVCGSIDYGLPIARDFTLLGPGFFVDLLKKASGREPIVAGKPSLVIKEIIVERHPSLNAQRTLFIGDSLVQDMAQGSLCGFLTLLVLTGLNSLEEAENASTTTKPKYVSPSLKALIPSLRQLVAA